jgi:hypothetical protein
MTKNVGPETPPTAYIYDEKSWSQDFPYSLYMACSAYIYDVKIGPETSPAASTCLLQRIYMTKKSWSRELPYSLYMAWTAYIYDEKCWSRDFPYSL